MFDFHKEDTFSKNEKKLKALIAHSKRQDDHLEKILHDHQISAEELVKFLSNSNNFDSATWKAMEEMRKEIHQKMKTDSNQVKDPLSTKKKYQDIHQAKKWIPVR